jgi:hypothetical protein
LTWYVIGMTPEQKKVHESLCAKLMPRSEINFFAKPEVNPRKGNKEWSMAMQARKMAKRGIPRL